MKLISVILISITITLVAGQSAPRRKPEKKKIPELTQHCLNCICQASSNCDETIKCHNSGSAYFCGPYVIGWPYWHDAGRPGDYGKPHDFENCLNNKTCAELAVKGYMRKYGQDCDGSGKIDCYDFARIHKLGFSSCGGAIENSDYYQKFEICHDGYEQPNQPYQPIYQPPYQPNQPGQPNQPYEPDQPAQPEQPYEPDQPAQPEQPYEPDQPNYDYGDDNLQARNLPGGY